MSNGTRVTKETILKLIEWAQEDEVIIGVIIASDKEALAGFIANALNSEIKDAQFWGKIKFNPARR